MQFIQFNSIPFNSIWIHSFPMDASDPEPEKTAFTCSDRIRNGRNWMESRSICIAAPPQYVLLPCLLCCDFKKPVLFFFFVVCTTTNIYLLLHVPAGYSNRKRGRRTELCPFFFFLFFFTVDGLIMNKVTFWSYFYSDSCKLQLFGWRKQTKEKASLGMYIHIYLFI